MKVPLPEGATVPLPVSTTIPLSKGVAASLPKSTAVSLPISPVSLPKGVATSLPIPLSKSTTISTAPLPVSTTTMRRVSDINWSTLSQRRGGVLPVLEGPDYRLYIVSVGAIEYTISDFAGRKEESDSDLLDTCLREFAEESFNSFGSLTRSDVEDDRVLEDNDTVLILHHFDYERAREYCRKGNKIAKSNSCYETQLFLPLTSEQVRRSLSIDAEIEHICPLAYFGKFSSLLTKYSAQL